MIPSTTVVNYTSWITVETIFNYFIFKYHKSWWQCYNYVLSAALDVGLDFMAILLYFALGLDNTCINWWGASGVHCPLVGFPIAKGVQVDGCPAFLF